MEKSCSSTLLFLSQQEKGTPLFPQVRKLEIDFGLFALDYSLISQWTAVWLVEQNIFKGIGLKGKSVRVEWTCHLALRNPAAGLGGGVGVGWESWCHSGGGRGVCVCNWSAVAGDLLWRGGMREGLTRLGCSSSTQTHPLTLTHSHGSETLQIETSPLCPPSVPFGPWKFWITKWVAIQLGSECVFSDFPLGSQWLSQGWYVSGILPGWLGIWIWCCRHVARTLCNPGTVEVNESFMWRWKKGCFSWR